MDGTICHFAFRVHGKQI